MHSYTVSFIVNDHIRLIEKMCILFLHVCDNPEPGGYRLIAASNRDELYNRPTATAGFHWNEKLVGGMDLTPGKSGGTWLGISKDGLFGALTNYRQAAEFNDPTRKGRGSLVIDYLKQGGNVADYLESVRTEGDQYNGFNLLVGKVSLEGNSQAGCYCNVEDKRVKMLHNPGTYVLSNRVLDYPWPKVVYGRQRFTEIMQTSATKQELTDKLMDLLNERARHFPGEDDSCFIGPRDEQCPAEYLDGCRALFVICNGFYYGTRTNTVILVDANGHATFVERTMAEGSVHPDQAEWLVNTHEFDIETDSKD